MGVPQQGERFAYVAIYALLGVAASFAFLFTGVPYRDWCAVTDDADRCLGLLALLPLPFQQVAAVAVIAWCVRLAWHHRLEEEGEAERKAKQDVALAQWRSELQSDDGKRPGT